MAEDSRLSSIFLTPESAGLVTGLTGSLNSFTVSFKEFTNYDAASSPGRIGQTAPYEQEDWRARISLPSGSNLFYNSPSESGILAPLYETNGVVFPYTPQISVTYEASYDNMSPLHTNYQQSFYKFSQIQAIRVSGEFTVQNISEGRYVLACIHFLRAATRMFYGNGEHVGNPPTIVLLRGYGQFYFPNVPCVITTFTHNMPQEVDYIPISPAGATDRKFITRLPTSSTIEVTLMPVYSRKNLYDNYELKTIANGSKLQNGGNFL